MALAALLIALLTRETAGRFIHLDRALVSWESCYRGTSLSTNRPAG